MTIQTDLQNVVKNIQKDSELLHAVIHGDETQDVSIEGGKVKSLSKVLKELRETFQKVLSQITMTKADWVENIEVLNALSKATHQDVENAKALVHDLKLPTRLEEHKGQLLTVKEDATGYENLPIKDVLIKNNLGLNWRGAYNAESSYEKGDVVFFKGSSFIALKSVSNASVKNRTPVMMRDDWDVLSASDPSRRVWKLAKVNGMGGWHTRVYLMADGTIKTCGYDRPASL